MADWAQFYGLLLLIRAAEALPAWRSTPAPDRIQPLFKLKYLLEENFEDISRTITLECGKTIGESRGEMRRAIENVEMACGIPMMMQGDFSEDIASGIDEIMIRQPVGVCAVIAGSGLVASDEEGGQLDLIMAHPLNRTAFFFGRLGALLIASLVIVFLGWIGFIVLLGGSALELTWFEMALPFLPLLVQVLLYCTLALLMSMLLPARRLAALVAGLVLVIGFLLSSLSTLNEGLESIAAFLPYAYFQGSDALNGLNLGWLSGLLAASLLLSLLAWWRFQRRDIRVAGEGGW